MASGRTQDGSAPTLTLGKFAHEIRAQGFTEVYIGVGKPQIDIVIVHGLQGHPETTWAYNSKSKAQDDTSPSSRKFFGLSRKPKAHSNRVSKSPSGAPKNDTNVNIHSYWPSELLPADFQDTRVLTYGYDSHVSHFFRDTANQNNIFTLGRDLLHKLVAYRVDDPTRPLLFISHSLGGLVVKDVLTISNASFHWRG